jgi:hypothetical protein
MKDSTIRAVAAMVCVSIIEVVALWTKTDGAILAAVVAAIAGLGGWTAATMRAKGDGGTGGQT